MEQYISKSALLAEIDRLEKINQEYKKTWKWKFQWFYRTIKGRLEVLEGLKNYINSLEVKKAEEKFEHPKINVKDAIEVSSAMKYIDDDLKPIADFTLDYANWNLHKDEWGAPTLEVPLFRVLDALMQRGKNYCVGN